MPNATVRANSPALPEAEPSTNTLASNAPASPKSALIEDYDELLVAKAVADTRLAVADAKRKREADKAAAAAEKAEEDKGIEASTAFSNAYHAWLAATAGVEEPNVAEDQQSDRFLAEHEAGRRYSLHLPSTAIRSGKS